MIPAVELVAALMARGETVATAESLTGGLLGAALTEVPGSSAVFLGGVISYATAVKAGLLGVSAQLLASAGPVDPQVAAGMAEGARRLLSADWAVSTTGVAGPAAQGTAPVGTVYVGCAGPDGTTVSRLDLAGTRSEIRRQSVLGALDLLTVRLAGC